MKQASFGNAAPKHRSIDVGANLLAQWTEEQARMRKGVARHLAILGGALVALAAVAPPLWNAGSAESKKVAVAQAGIRRLDEGLTESDRALKAAKPAKTVEAMCDTTRDRFDRFLNATDRVLAAGNARTALSSVRAEMQSGDLQMLVQGLAEDEGAAEAFSQAAGEEGAKVSAITNSRPSEALAPKGIGFEYAKRVAVGE